MTHSHLAYLRAVQDALVAQRHDSRMDQAEYSVVIAGESYGIGAHDCAAQIVANRGEV